MTNKVSDNLSVPRELAAHFAYGGALAVRQEELRTILAKPVAPIEQPREIMVAGREVEVLACASFARNGNIQCWSLQRDHASLKKLEGEGNRVVELVDSQHITALSAQLATSEKWAREHCNRAEEFAGQIIELRNQVEARDQRIADLENRGLEFSLQNALPQRKYYSSGEDDWFRGQGKGFNECLDKVIPLVTRLQAEVERLKENYEAAVKGRQAFRNACRKHRAERTALQSELTKARELLGEFCERVEKGEVRSKRTYANFKSFLDYQSAPAIKFGDN